MSNFLIVGCDGITNLVVDGGPYFLNPGNTYFISFTAETFPSCFTISGVTEEPAVDGISSAVEYNNCLSCLQESNYSFYTEDCTNPELNGLISAYSFTEWPVGKYYKLCQDIEGQLVCLCLYIKEASSEPSGAMFLLEGPFTECGCGSVPRSANTESNLCVEICTESGTTVTSVVPPHPVWTDGYNTSVTQLNMITLGGENGLNN
jgi:hypothetical protein